MELSPDILEQLKTDFPPEQVPEVILQLRNELISERVQRCIVFAARGHRWYLDFLCKQAAVDYRDVIMAAEYERFGTRLYDFNRPIGQAKLES
ncbi:hypothetical protein [Planctomicrobium piriforme]|uniref:Uncharacterized protein n=1 Tax=Planctomicrobium piriforme TaxID=1576369 RepID=A0A1I3RLY0_9PLAN|nr:hypothetical protein [Planctomicrobium piriforme]SFJ46176.1 hypothetical protein SAMN05421753_12113 [Planctomicrobium piriforme]